MTSQYATPGVYIEEVTGPGVIAGVSTSTAAFIGPASRGQINVPLRISSFDDFIAQFGTTVNGRPWPYLYVQGRWYYMPFGVQGFFTNQGQLAYIVRVGTAVQASLGVKNQDAASQLVFTIRALLEGTAGNQIQAAIEHYTIESVAKASATIQAVDSTANTVTVDQPTGFQAGDLVQVGSNAPAQIDHVQGYNLFMKTALAGAAANQTVRTADIPAGQLSFRLVNAAGISSGTSASGGMALMGPGSDDPFQLNTAAVRVAVQNVDPSTAIVTLVATPAKPPYDLSVEPPKLTSVRLVVQASTAISNITTITNLSGNTVSQFTAANPERFRPGDIVTADGTHTAQIAQLQGNTVALDRVLSPLTSPLRIADIVPNQTTFRVADTTGLYPGTIAILRGTAPTNVQQYVLIQSVDSAGFVTVASATPIANTFGSGTTDQTAPILIPQEFRLIVTPPTASGAGTPERFENLSLEPSHPRYILASGLIQSQWVEIDPPDVPPTTTGYPARLVPIGGPTALSGGQDDQPGQLTAANYQAALDALRDVDGISMICIPDASSHPDRQTIQSAMIDHCLDRRDRVAILDSVRGAPPTGGSGSVEAQRTQVQADNGFAALYYPWLMVRDPTSSGPVPASLLVPPSGFMAGIWARTDQDPGVHKAPANTDVRGVLGLEQVLSDRQQGPLNLEGINVLRIFPGTGIVTVWGARTTVDPTITDWIYVSTRRLMIYIEQSIQDGIRWAVFEPNNLILWQRLKREISEFLTRVWKDGALFGATADQAFYVRIDAGLNPPSTMALGQLFIEIGVAVVRPAEFIIVRIGLWDGGAQISE